MYALVGEDGKSVGTSMSLPLQVPAGLRLSYIRRLKIFGDVTRKRFHYKDPNSDAEGTVTYEGNDSYFIEVIGSTIDGVTAVVTRFETELGVVELPPPRPLFPALGSAWARFMLIVNYIRSGKTE